MELIRDFPDTDEPKAKRKAGKAAISVRVPFVDLKAQYRSIAGEVDERVKDVLSSTDFILGQGVEAFEKDFAGYCGAEYAVGVASGTDALHLSLAGLGIGPGDEVMTQANTFIATLLAIWYSGARPVLVDVDPVTMNINCDELRAAVTPSTRAVMPVHLYGKVAPMQRIRRVADEKGLFIVEDACQAHGAYHYSLEGGVTMAHRTGSLGDVAAFSFYPGKNLGAYGDGGAVTTNNPVINEKIRMLRNYGQAEKHNHVMKGFNSRLDTVQAAVLNVKLKRLDRWNSLRGEHAQMYSELLAGIPEVILPDFDPSLKAAHVFHLFVVRAKERDALIRHLADKGVATGIHYPVPAHMHPAFVELGYARGDFPVTERLAGEIISLPMYPELTPGEVEYVAGAIREFYGR